MGRRSGFVLGDVAFVPLTRGQVAMLDAADLPLVSGPSWSTKPNRSTFYAACRRGGHASPLTLMHRVILGLGPSDGGIDHIDGNGLNNRRSNLRAASHSENMANSAGRSGSSHYKGVCRTASGRWMATITVNGRWQYLGVYADEVDAALAYDASARDAWPDHAHLNFGDA